MSLASCCCCCIFWLGMAILWLVVCVIRCSGSTLATAAFYTLARQHPHRTWRSGALNTGICASQPASRVNSHATNVAVMRADFAPVETAKSRFSIYDTSEATLRIKRNFTSGRPVAEHQPASIRQGIALGVPACCNNYVLGVDMFVCPWMYSNDYGRPMSLRGPKKMCSGGCCRMLDSLCS